LGTPIDVSLREILDGRKKKPRFRKEFGFFVTLWFFEKGAS
jgi:hypothetical protein